DGEIAEGLKTALEVGTDSSVFKTSAANGFYKDAAIKILLPEEAQVILDNVSKIGGQAVIDDLILKINRSAEDAAKSAGPIFKESIKNLTITDALAILNGKNPASSKKSASFDSTAATGYLKSTTLDQLTASFSVPINASLDKEIVGGVSTNEAWKQITTAYNAYALIWGKPQVNTSLGNHVTQKALIGLFSKVEEQEIHIRRDPWKWISSTVGDILTKVFGS
ncbi:MAG TPA: DUF4197 domain-containing protein, partial [Bacteroidales bacterium]|nr:DUF4197 domain-containing protein [Bacteroidales bacterium]